MDIITIMFLTESRGVVVERAYCGTFIRCNGYYYHNVFDREPWSGGRESLLWYIYNIIGNGWYIYHTSTLG